MTGSLFSRPLFVQRQHFVQEVGCLDDIFDLLEEWPADKRDVAYETMLRACRDAAVGRFPLGAVRDNFRRFLKKDGLLVEIESVPFVSRGPSDRNVDGK